jgi:oligopeptide transport system substrate-binding protein
MRHLTSILALICAIGATACRQETQVERATRNGILILGNSNEPKGLGPHSVSGVLESNLMRALFEGFVSFHPVDDAAYVLSGAEALESDDSATVWTVRLRPEAVWNDGTPVTSRDYLFSYHRILHPEFAAKYAEMLYFLKNARAYNLDLRGEILFRISPPADGPGWEALEAVNFRGEEDLDTAAIDGREWSDLDDSERRLHVRARGLDRLDAPALDWIAEKPRQRFAWPENFTHAETVLRRLREHAGADLFELAEVGIRTIDKFTFELTLRGPTPYFPQIAKHYTWVPVPRHVVLRHGKIHEKANPWAKQENIVTNGPFQLKSWHYNDHIEVERSPTYWNAENVSLDGVRFLPITNAYTEARMFRNGQLHMTYSAPPEVIDYMKEKNPAVLRQEPYVGTLFYRFNVNREPFDDPRVRRALGLAIDRRAITEKILKGYVPAWGMTPPMAGYRVAERETYDPERARELLAEAGYPGGEGFPRRLKILIASRETTATLAQAVQAMWSETLGIQVEIENKEWTAYLAAMQDLDYDIASAGWIGDFLDPLTFLEMWTEGNGNNLTGWSNETYEDLLEQSNQEADPEARFELLRRAENLFLDESPTTSIAWYSRNYLLHPAVKGWEPLLLDNHPYDKIRLEQPAN